jgi:hypothetical protein
MGFWKDTLRDSLRPVSLLFSALGILLPYYLLVFIAPQHCVRIAVGVLIANLVGYAEGRSRNDRKKSEKAVCSRFHREDDDDTYDDNCPCCHDRPSV